MSDDTPAPRRALFALPPVTDPVSGGGASASVTEPETPPVTLPPTVSGSPASNAPAVTAKLETLGGGVPMSPGERARLAVSRRAGTVAAAAGRLWLNPGRVLHSLRHDEPETMAEHRVYIRSRAWVPPELTGRSATVIAVAGFMYHILIGHPLKAAAKTAREAARQVDKAAQRPLRLLPLIVFIVLLFVIVPHL